MCHRDCYDSPVLSAGSGTVEAVLLQEMVVVTTALYCPVTRNGGCYDCPVLSAGSGTGEAVLLREMYLHIPLCHLLEGVQRQVFCGQDI